MTPGYAKELASAVIPLLRQRGWEINEFTQPAIDDLAAAMVAGDAQCQRLGMCEHGVIDGGWCEQCRAEYRLAAIDEENG